MKDQAVETYVNELKKLGIAHTILEHPQLISVAEVQKYLGYGVDDSAATLVMKADDKFIAIIRRGDTKLDNEKVKKLLKIKTLRMATEEEFAGVTGVLSGAASVYIPGLSTYIDKKVFEKNQINAGSGSLLFTIRYKSEDLKKIPGITVIDATTLEQKSILTQKPVMNKRFLSGITPSGDGSLHIGNYLGAVKQFIALSKSNETYLMVADYHALTTIQDKKQLQHNVETLILNELALLQGFLTEEEFNKIVFFRQSDISGFHTELQSILNNVTPLGLLKRAHAYKDKLAKDVMEDEINVGLFSYPMLMAADILLYKPDLVPVGKDQKQHVEITRDIAGRFNNIFKKQVFKLPDPYIPEDVASIMGTDGKRKMSKTLGNIISIFEKEEIIQKQVNSTYTDPTRAHATDPGHIGGNMVFTYLDFFGEKQKVAQLKEHYTKGQISDVEVKKYLIESLMKIFKKSRERYEDLKSHPEKVKKILETGAAKAKQVAMATMQEVHEAIGLVNAYSLKSIQSSVIGIDDFSKVEMRVGKVKEATNKEGSEKLIRLVVDIGEATPRVIFTAVRPFGYTPEFFSGKQFFFITNLLPRKMLDEFSQGMIMAVDGADNKPQFISAEGMPVGAKIH
jgi:tryptophanyl-tRNA synthetase